MLPNAMLYHVEGSFKRERVYDLRDTLPNRCVAMLYTPIVRLLNGRIEWSVLPRERTI